MAKLFKQQPVEIRQSQFLNRGMNFDFCERAGQITYLILPITQFTLCVAIDFRVNTPRSLIN